MRAQSSTWPQGPTDVSGNSLRNATETLEPAPTPRPQASNQAHQGLFTGEWPRALLGRGNGDGPPRKTPRHLHRDSGSRHGGRARAGSSTATRGPFPVHAGDRPAVTIQGFQQHKSGLPTACLRTERRTVRGAHTLPGTPSRKTANHPKLHAQGSERQAPPSSASWPQSWLRLVGPAGKTLIPTHTLRLALHARAAWAGH